MPTLTLTPTKHAQLDKASPDFNLSGDSDVLAIRNQLTPTAGTLRHVLTFSLATLPAGAAVATAVVNLYYEDQSPASNQVAFRVHQLTKAWVEAEVTWNRYNAANLWATAGGDYNAASASGTTLGVFTSGLAQTLNVKALITWGTDTLADFIFKFLTETEDAATDTETHWDTRLFFNNKAPELVITYDVSSYLWIEGADLHHVDAGNNERLAQHEGKQREF